MDRKSKNRHAHASRNKRQRSSPSPTFIDDDFPDDLISSSSQSSFPHRGDAMPAPIPAMVDQLYEPFPSLPVIKGAIHEPFRNFASERDSRLGWKTDKLHRMFAPPVHLLFSGTFEQGFIIGEQSERWILVNVQASDVFASHTLNRDIWSDRQIQSFIGENFLFLQLPRDSSEGARFMSFYRVTKLPYIAIIDPRTRQNLWHWESSGEDPVSSLSVGDLLRKWRQVLSLNSFKHQGPTSSLGLTQPTSTATARPLTEEEQLEAAIRASLEEDNEVFYDDEELSILSSKLQGKTVIDLDDETDMIDLDDDVNDGHEVVETADSLPQGQLANNLHQDSFPIPPEPQVGPSVTRIVVRLPDGQRSQRRFSKTDQIGNVLAYAISLLPPTDDHNIESYRLVTTHPRTELNDRHHTLEEASVLNAALTLEVVS